MGLPGEAVVVVICASASMYVCMRVVGGAGVGPHSQAPTHPCYCV